MLQLMLTNLLAAASIFLPHLPTTGTAPSTSYSELLELAFVAGAGIISVIVILRDPIYPKNKTRKS